ncbi:uncharacterized protein LOC106070736 isoform X1 [Biomphalaria glabrata]|uniref:Uncharacterized protein LOC106070736 isoform X1 n=1 Tax=Biomphalaria glabrata TaxID=6526 RepID=A0A9W3ABN9_BIOGL|nr:uncharacterized protein LOC106070736 isoform X1 [Biomphalaria glabrata]
MDRFLILFVFAISLQPCFLQEQDIVCYFFKEFCRYKCHCNRPCEDDFKCSDDDKCQSGWFGYRCQYQDLAVFNATLTTNPLGMNISWLTDQNDYTCNTANDLKSVTVTWPVLKAIPLSWTRVTVNEPQSLSNVELQFTREGTAEKSSCLNETFSEVNNKTLDRRCNDDVTITSLTLSGNLSSLCSFYISGGRNIAYGQHASQSSDWTLSRLVFRADVAVDGNTNSIMEVGSCTHTEKEIAPSWNLTLQSNYVIKRFTIYNRGDGHEERLQGFVINTYDENRARIGYYEDRSGLCNVLIYFINLNGNVNDTVNVISIRLNGEQKILTLCEVEAYGECPSGKWSLQCGKLCPASCPKTCDRDTGACNTVCFGYSNPPQCDTVCASGKWGINCRNTCNNGCFEGKCNIRTGLCDKGCMGYSDAPYCGSECSKDRWGINCSNICSQNCYYSTCDSFTGHCDQGCLSGYQLPDCTRECTEGQWGVNCTSTCNKNCYDKICNPKEGSCNSGCIEGFQPPICTQECVIGTYGRNCLFNCSSLCVNAECDPVKGACNKCPSGYEGHACDIKTFSLELNSFGIGFVVGTLALVLVIIALLLNKTLVFHWSQRTESLAVRTNLQLKECPNYDYVTDTAHQPDDVNNEYETTSTNKCYEDVLANSPYDCINVT